MTDIDPETQMTEEEYHAALTAEILKITDEDVRQALFNHSVILKSFERILTQLSERQTSVERIIMTMIGGSLAPKPPTPPTESTLKMETHERGYL